MTDILHTLTPDELAKAKAISSLDDDTIRVDDANDAYQLTRYADGRVFDRKAAERALLAIRDSTAVDILKTLTPDELAQAKATRGTASPTAIDTAYSVDFDDAYQLGRYVAGLSFNREAAKRALLTVRDKASLERLMSVTTTIVPTKSAPDSTAARALFSEQVLLSAMEMVSKADQVHLMKIDSVSGDTFVKIDGDLNLTKVIAAQAKLAPASRPVRMSKACRAYLLAELRTVATDFRTPTGYGFDHLDRLIAELNDPRANQSSIELEN